MRTWRIAAALPLLLAGTPALADDADGIDCNDSVRP